MSKSVDIIVANTTSGGDIPFSISCDNGYYEIVNFFNIRRC
jgi:hypothetical protein